MSKFSVGDRVRTVEEIYSVKVASSAPVGTLGFVVGFEEKYGHPRVVLDGYTSNQRDADWVQNGDYYYELVSAAPVGVTEEFKVGDKVHYVLGGGKVQEHYSGVVTGVKNSVNEYPVKWTFSDGMTGRSNYNPKNLILVPPTTEENFEEKYNALVEKAKRVLTPAALGDLGLIPKNTFAITGVLLTDDIITSALWQYDITVEEIENV